MTATLTAISLDAVAGNSDSSGQGSDHGANHNRLIRLSDGTLVHCYLTGSATPWQPGVNGDTSMDYHKPVIIMAKRPGGTWSEVARTECGFTHGELVRLPNDDYGVVCAPKGVLSLWRKSTGVTAPLSGGYAVTDWPYMGAGIAPDGTLWVVQTQITGNTASEDVPGLLNIGHFKPDGSLIQFTQVKIPVGRYAYWFVFPQADGTVDLFAELDVLASEAGYQANNAQFSYVFADPAHFTFNPTTKALAGPHVMLKGTTWTVNGTTYYPQLNFGDVLQLADGSYLATFAGPDGSTNGNYSNFIARVARDGTLLEPATISPLMFANQTRFAQMPDGSIIAYFCESMADQVTPQPPSTKTQIGWMSRSGPAAPWGPVQYAYAGSWTWVGYPANMFGLAPRSGAVMPNDASFFVATTVGGPDTSGSPARVGQFQLTGITPTPAPAPVPVPAPTPTPAPVPAPTPAPVDPDAAPIAALQAAVAALTTNLAALTASFNSVALQVAALVGLEQSRAKAAEAEATVIKSEEAL